MISKSEIDFLRDRILPYFHIKNVDLTVVQTSYKHPDCWVHLNKKPPLIVVTQEWLKQGSDERLKRLVHELLHLMGEKHGKRGKLLYSTYPDKDSYSMVVYNKIKGVVK